MINFWQQLNEQQGDLRIVHESTRVSDSTCRMIARHLYNATSRAINESAIRQALESRGTMRPAKALAKLLRESGADDSPAIREQLGQIARGAESDPVTLRFSLRVDGEREDYYNDNSCFWTDYSLAREYIAGYGGGAVRAYDPESGDLIGRCWFWPYHGEDLHHGLILYNAYGDGDYQHCQTWGQIVADALQADACNIRLILPYQMFNNQSANCWFVGDIEKMPATRYIVNFETLPLPEVLRYHQRCGKCGHATREERMALTIDGPRCNDCLYHYARVEIGEGAGIYYPEAQVAILHTLISHERSIVLRSWANDQDLIAYNGAYFYRQECPNGFPWPYLRPRPAESISIRYSITFDENGDFHAQPLD